MWYKLMGAIDECQLTAKSTVAVLEEDDDDDDNTTSNADSSCRSLLTNLARSLACSGGGGM
jgi:hypothetical protein